MQGGVKTIVLFPLKSHDTLLGYLWATNFDPEDSVRIKEALHRADELMYEDKNAYYERFPRE